MRLDTQGPNCCQAFDRITSLCRCEGKPRVQITVKMSVAYVLYMRRSVMRRRVVVGGAWRHFNGTGQHVANLTLHQRYEVIALALTL